MLGSNKKNEEENKNKMEWEVTVLLSQPANGCVHPRAENNSTDEVVYFSLKLKNGIRTLQCGLRIPKHVPNSLTAFCLFKIHPGVRITVPGFQPHL